MVAVVRLVVHNVVLAVPELVVLLVQALQSQHHVVVVPVVVLEDVQAVAVQLVLEHLNHRHVLIAQVIVVVIVLLHVHLIALVDVVVDVMLVVAHLVLEPAIVLV